MSSNIDFSLENNPDSQPALSYQQLEVKFKGLETKYKQLFVENERLSDYIALLQQSSHRKAPVSLSRSGLDKIQ